MRDISETRKKYETLFANKFCKVDGISQCPHKECTCKIAAELKAYLQTVLPRLPVDYSKFTIKDFNGRSEQFTELLNNKTALDAKLKIAQYCWNITDTKELKELENQTEILDIKSVMDNRLRDGSNVIIYGDSVERVNNDEDGIKVINNVKRGRTLAAAIIMKEAIKRRVKKENLTCSYDWINFASLKKALGSRDDTAYKDWQSADWLVIDDITDAPTDGGQSYTASLLDPFLQERISDSLPTIFVFRFDITKKDMEKSFGVLTNTIINSHGTFVVKLS